MRVKNTFVSHSVLNHVVEGLGLLGSLLQSPLPSLLELLVKLPSKKRNSVGGFSRTRNGLLRINALFKLISILLPRAPHDIFCLKEGCSRRAALLCFFPM